MRQLQWCWHLSRYIDQQKGIGQCTTLSRLSGKTPGFTATESSCSSLEEITTKTQRHKEEIEILCLFVSLCLCGYLFYLISQALYRSRDTTAAADETGSGELIDRHNRRAPQQASIFNHIANLL